MIYSDGNVRDYGTVVPINVAMSVTISSNTVALVDNNSAPISTSANSFQVLPTDIEVTGAPPSPITRMFPPPDAEMIHVYTAGLR
jgi:Ni,Fe-hydrogenase III small subunit